MLFNKKIHSFVRGVRQYGLFNFLRLYFTEMDNTLQGRWVEWRGNQVKLEGMTFSVDTPAVPTINKSQLLQGRYERPERDFAKRYLNSAQPVIELGGALGVVACLINRQLDDPSQHVVVEANPLIVSTLEHNRLINRCHFMIIPAAIAYGVNIVNLHQSGFSSGVHTHSGLSARIPTTTLSEIVQMMNFASFTLVCDIEGAEIDLVHHELECLGNYVETIIMEMHLEVTGAEAVERCIDHLDGLNFQLVDQAQQVYVFGKR